MMKSYYYDGVAVACLQAGFNKARL